MDTAALVDPATYEDGPPFVVLRRLRAEAPVTWVEEPALHGQPAGPGFWLVLRHADVERVLKDPATFSSWLGATQIRDAADLAWVRRMMLNMDPPDRVSGWCCGTPTSSRCCATRPPSPPGSARLRSATPVTSNGCAG